MINLLLLFVEKLLKLKIKFTVIYFLFKYSLLTESVHFVAQ